MSGLPSDALGRRAALRVDGAGRHAFDDAVIAEQPIAFAYNGLAHAVMLATPADLDDFALGFSLNEGIVDEASQLRLVDVQRSTQGIALELAVSQDCFDRLASRRRHLAGASGCGLCGLESLQQTLREPPAVRDDTRVRATDIVDGMRRLQEAQPLNRESGGVHAAAWVSGRDLLVREDVGRHNALDKLVGALARTARPSGFLALSSRASYELVHKAACAGMGVVAVISAPTTLAIDLAERSGITLVAFVRGEQMNVYSNTWRIAD
ncbi:formate dehydrogenase accessory sulfurtransferase FdhD [Cognatilysobacter terrigena]|uniref:formate dehydrogenase accessory sulfurtransferase FdhD n=1 Tax=Cognatilysobacter terrigena TaxID=2488749 RepID=UPI00105B858D|nr:formate dehydrogenase accessory sulfurtransferase FdhD [Lysobacter terrigena]